jgi:hypothetical protein
MDFAATTDEANLAGDDVMKTPFAEISTHD